MSSWTQGWRLKRSWGSFEKVKRELTVEKRKEEMERLSNEKYLNKVLDEDQMDMLRQVVSLDFSKESMQTLMELSRQFVNEDQHNYKEKVGNLNEKQKEMKRLRQEISEKEDLRDKLTIVGLTRKRKLKKPGLERS
jgi:oligoribonuclease NrnB/cAMP/cGMP phosphodiesterase (DHH superfamily)